MNRMENKLKQPIQPFNMLEKLKDYLGSYNCNLFVVYIPSRHQVTDYYLTFAAKYSNPLEVGSLTGQQYQTHAITLNESCNALGIPFLDLTERIKEKEQKGERCYWDYDEHCRGKCYLWIGELIYKEWFVSDTQ